MGPGGEGWGPAFPFGWNNKVAWSTVCEPLNAGLPPKKHLHDLTHRARRSCPNRALTNTETHTDTPHLVGMLVGRALPLLRESARIKGDKAGVRKQRPHATVASPPSVRRPRQRAPPAACCHSHQGCRCCCLWLTVMQGGGTKTAAARDSGITTGRAAAASTCAERF